MSLPHQYWNCRRKRLAVCCFGHWGAGRASSHGLYTLGLLHGVHSQAASSFQLCRGPFWFS
jgi:hypothetical protein